MAKPINKAKLQEFYKRISFLFKKIDTVRSHLDIIFVFGGIHQGNARNLFLDYAKSNNNTPFKFMIIEDLFKDIVKFSGKKKGVSAKKIELAKLELESINNAYSILIFPESPGSYAELGFFSFSETTREKILVMNKLQYQQTQCYVNELIDLIHDKQLRPFSYVNERINDTFSKYFQHLMLNYDNLDEYEKEIYITKEKVNENIFNTAIIYESIKYFPYLTFSELKDLITIIIDDLDIKILNLDKYLTSIISLLKISELISRTELKDDSKIFNVKKFDYNLVKLSQNFDEDMFRKILEIRIEIINEKGIEDEI